MLMKPISFMSEEEITEEFARLDAKAERKGVTPAIENRRRELQRRLNALVSRNYED